MPRKIKSSGEPTQQRETSARRAAGAQKKPGKSQSNMTAVQDGGKWAGSGRKTAETNEGPEVRQQGNTGRGARTRTVRRAGGAA